MTEKFLGKYQLGSYMVKLYVRPKDCGGYFYTHFSTDELPHMSIGLDYGTFGQVMGVLTHEASEFAAGEENVVYRKSGTWAPNASDAYYFNFNHNEFTEICSKVGCFLSMAGPHIEKEWQKSRKRKR